MSVNAAPPPVFASASRELPIGAVRPEGWLRQYLQTQVAGLTGHIGPLHESVDRLAPLAAGELLPGPDRALRVVFQAACADGIAMSKDSDQRADLLFFAGRAAPPITPANQCNS